MDLREDMEDMTEEKKKQAIEIQANPPMVPYPYGTIKSVKVGIPIQWTLFSQCVGSILNLMKVEGVSNIELQDACPLEVARNMIAKPEQPLVDPEKYPGYDHFDAILYIDSDLVYPPENAVYTIQSLQNFPIIGGLYPKYTKKLHHVYLWRGKGEAPKYYEKQDEGVGGWVEMWIPEDAKHTIQVDRIGSGWMAIRRDVFERFDKEKVPYFAFVGRSEKGGSEDFWFCDHAREFGFPIVVDCRIRCNHITLKSVWD